MLAHPADHIQVKRPLFIVLRKAASFGGLCESCGKEFNAVIKAGKERDGQENQHFCNNCYSDGKFNEPDLTVDKIVIRVKEELRAIGIPNKKIARTIKVIKGLDRWKSQHYF
jgi:hypothetical protein